jgi:hypothetical protein
MHRAQIQRVCVSVAAFFVVGSVIPARAQSTSGSIDGLVLDQSGAVLQGVSITLVQPAFGVERTVISDGSGIFRAPMLPVGVYELIATRAGFESLRHADIRLSVGQTITMRLQMQIARVAQTVTVRSAASPIETGRSHASSSVNEIAVHTLPVNGRNFIDFVLLTAGVTRDVRLGDLSFAGQRGTLNSLVVDGADNNNTFAGQTLGRAGSGRAPYQFSLEAVEEFQVNSNSFLAEMAVRRSRGSTPTRSGTNGIRGSGSSSTGTRH